MKKKIALIVSSPSTFKSFYKNHIEALSKLYDVTLIANFDTDDIIVENTKQISVDIERKPSVFSDLNALKQMTKIFRTEKFDLVHSTTPKAGFITQIAGILSGTQFRLHTFTGQVWASKSGIKRKAIKQIDVVIATLATHLLADSQSQVDFLTRESIPNSSKIEVLGNGSISGVNLSKFTPQNTSELKCKLGLQEKSFIFLFLGRLNKDKGVLDLIRSFEIVQERHPDSALLIVGPDEENIFSLIKDHHLYNKNIFHHPATTKPEEFMAMANVLCIPSYREGFGTVVIEASACGTPSIGSNIYGLSDAIEDNRSGYLFKAGNVYDLAKKMIYSLENPTKLKELSEYGRKRVVNKFSDTLSSKLLVDYYKSIIGN